MAQVAAAFDDLAGSGGEVLNPLIVTPERAVAMDAAIVRRS